MTLINKNFAALMKYSRNKDYRGIVMEGGSRCFSGETKVLKLKESGNYNAKCIKHIKAGDIVLSYDETDKVKIPGIVSKVFKMKPTVRTIRITMDSGESIVCTENHKFFFNGGWHEIKNILPLSKKKT